MCIYNWLTLLYSRKAYNIVKNKKRKKENKKQSKNKIKFKKKERKKIKKSSRVIIKGWDWILYHSVTWEEAQNQNYDYPNEHIVFGISGKSDKPIRLRGTVWQKLRTHSN